MGKLRPEKCRSLLSAADLADSGVPQLASPFPKAAHALGLWKLLSADKATQKVTGQKGHFFKI